MLTTLDLTGTQVTRAAVNSWTKERKANKYILPMFQDPKIKGVN
jgi:hypothetical protein